MRTSVSPKFTESFDPDQPLVRWVFQRDGETVTSQVDFLRSHGAFAVSLVPHSNLDASVIETWGNPLAALQRHATLAEAMRRAGWIISARG